jgi:hypothetical protein
MVPRRQCVAATTAIALECVERRAEWPRGRGRANQGADALAELVKSARSGFHNLLTGQIAHHAVNDLHLLFASHWRDVAEGGRRTRPSVATSVNISRANL